MSRKQKLTEEDILKILDNDLSDIESDSDNGEDLDNPNLLLDTDNNDTIFQGLQKLFGYEHELVDITLKPISFQQESPALENCEDSIDSEEIGNEDNVCQNIIQEPKMNNDTMDNQELITEEFRREDIEEISTEDSRNGCQNIIQEPERNNDIMEDQEFRRQDNLDVMAPDPISRECSNNNRIRPEVLNRSRSSIHLAKEWSEKIPKHTIPTFKVPMTPIRSYTHKSQPIDYFNNFFPELIYDIMVEETNRYAIQKHSKNWTPTNKSEICAFLGVLIMMGIHPLPDSNLYWSTDPFYRNPDISAAFTQKRFKKLVENFHLNDNSKEPLRSSPNFDKLYKVRPLITILNQTFQNECSQSTNQSIDECMIKFKGKSSLKQYMPKKPIKRGYKVWARCDANTGYLYCFDIYIGKEDENASSEDGLGYRVVMKLCEEVPPNTLIAFDNFFTGVPLMVDLLTKKGLYAVGTVRIDRRGLPQMPTKIEVEFNNKKRKINLITKNEFRYMSKSPVSLVQWMDTKLVSVLTTAHDPKSLTTVKRTQKDGSQEKINIPTAIAQYTLNMGGVDRFDHFRASYPIGRKSRRNWLRLFYFMFDAAVINSYLAYLHLHKQKVHTHRDYRLRLARSLVDGFTNKKNRKEIIFKNKRGGVFGVPEEIRHSSLPHYPEDQKKFTRCRFCSTKNQQKRSRIICHVCRVALCVTPCFKNFHASSPEDIDDMDISVASSSSIS